MTSDRPAALPRIADDEPIRLSVAAALAFPDGSMTASGLRREAARGRLTIERIAGKDFTTLRAINEMRKQCRVEAKAPVWLQPARRDKHGQIVERAVWVIRDGTIKRSTGCGQNEAAGAERALADYIAAKYRAPRISNRDPAACKVADVIAIYAEDVAHKHARPQKQLPD
jgi:hypothetical protein